MKYSYKPAQKVLVKTRLVSTLWALGLQNIKQTERAAKMCKFCGYEPYS